MMDDDVRHGWPTYRPGFKTQYGTVTLGEMRQAHALLARRLPHSHVTLNLGRDLAFLESKHRSAGLSPAAADRRMAHLRERIDDLQRSLEQAADDRTD